MVLQTALLELIKNEVLRKYILHVLSLETN